MCWKNFFFKGHYLSDYHVVHVSLQNNNVKNVRLNGLTNF